MRQIGVQPCILCCLARQFVSAEAVTRDYEIQCLVCPGCESVIRLVQKRGATYFRRAPVRSRRPVCETPAQVGRPHAEGS